MILLLGETGVGKSTFINKAIGRDVAEVGHELQPCTTDVEHFTIEHPKDPTRRVVFVDTPGFNSEGTWLEQLNDEKILERILDWLQTSCHQDVKLGGILYLHDINVCRENAGASFVASTILSRPKIAPNVRFATVKWKEPESAEQLRREQLIITNWKDMIYRGSKVARLQSTISPWSIVDKMLGSPAELDVIRQELRMILKQPRNPHSCTARNHEPHNPHCKISKNIRVIILSVPSS